MARIAIALLGALAACDRSAPPPANAPQPAGHVAATKNPWMERDGSQVRAVPEPLNDAALAQATRQAQATAEEARQRWEASTPEDRAHWAVKWAAPTSDGVVEHVWVRPVHWSAFRIEGLLDSPPQRELSCGKGAGEIVSFPIEELSDWIHATTSGAGGGGDFKGPREGGFTIDVLDQRQRQSD